MKDGRKIMLLALAAAAATWSIDSLLDWLVFYRSSSLLGILLLDVPSNKIFIRLLLVLTILAFGWIASRIIERRRVTEDELEKSERLLSSLIDQSPFPMWISDAYGVNIRQNPAFGKLLGIENENRTVGRYNLLEDNVLQEQGHLEKLERVFLRAEPISFQTEYDISRVTQLNMPAGPRLLLSATVFPITDRDGRVINAVIHYEDITGRRRVEDAIRASEQRFRAMFDISRDVMAIIDGRDRVQWTNLAWCDVFGFRPGAPVDWFDKLHPGDLERFTELWQNVQNGIGEVTNLEIRFKSTRGRYVVLETTIRRIELDRNESVFFDGYDVTQRNRAESYLAEEKERLRVTLQSIAEGVIATNAQGEVTLINSVAAELTGCNQEAGGGRQLSEVLRLFSESDSRLLENPMQEIPDAEFEAQRVSCLMISQSGENRTVEIRRSPITSENGDRLGAVFVLRDVTDIRRVEQELQRADKLDSLGVLAGGIAHDFNNILTSVLGNIELARIYGEGNAKVDETLERAKDSALSAKELTGRLLTFSKGGAPLKRRQDLAPFIRDSVRLALSGSNVGVEFDLREDLWQVEVDVEQFGQAVRNLVVNAMQAMPEGGTIRVAAVNALPDELETPGFSVPVIIISVADSGPGIRKELLPKIFDPFFSTKDRGSGLGLSVCYSVVNRHGGKIDVQSEPGRGTTFLIYLPAFPPERETLAVQNQLLRPRRSRLRVLIVDDEAPVRRLIGEMFSHLGHECVAVGDGREGLDQYAGALDSERQFDLVVLDLTIPGGMGGRETLNGLREIDPEVTAVVTSGYADDPILADFEAYGFNGSLVKPFDFGQVEKLVRRLFDPVRNAE